MRIISIYCIQFEAKFRLSMTISEAGPQVDGYYDVKYIFTCCFVFMTFVFHLLFLLIF